MNRKKIIVFFALVQYLLWGSLSATTTVQTFYGPIQISDPLTLEIIQHPAMQRLKHIHQYGIISFSVPTEAYSRYDHSLGVFALLNKINAPYEEQIAGLLHDISHTVFSHVGDFIYDNMVSDQVAYQDMIHLNYLKECGIAKLFEQYNFSLKQADPKQDKYAALEQELPHMCADRIDYNIQGAFLRRLITEEDVKDLLEDLHFDGKRWFFTDPNLAKLFARIPLNMTERLWGAPWNILAYKWCAQAIKYSLQKEYLNVADIHFSTDEKVWNTLKNIKDPYIKDYLNKIQSLPTQFKETPEGSLSLFPKFRGIDPWVKTPNGLQKLSRINPKFKAEFARVKQRMTKGWKIAINDKKDSLANSEPIYSH